MAKARTTIDHDTIKSWVEEHGGTPARVKGTGAEDDPGVLRILYPTHAGKQTLEPISWDAFFEAFEYAELAFVYQDDKKRRFSKLVSRDTVELAEEEGSTRSAKSDAPDAIELLEQQHREVEELFEKLRRAKSDSQKARVFIKLANALAAHMKLEETMFYPAMFDEDTEDELRESVEEHLVGKRLLADLLETEYADPQFISKVHVLEQVVMLHVQREEQELFKEIRASEAQMEDLRALGRKMEERYEVLMESEPKDVVPEETSGPSLPF